MSAVAWIGFVVAAAAAVADWVAVWRRPSRAENVLKPLVLVALIVLALALHPTDDAQRAWFVVALVLSLAGDVLLLPDIDRFVLGLASFLLAHVAYIVGFAVAGDGSWPPIGLVVVLALVVPGARRVVTAVRRDEPDLFVPVVTYIAVISTMVASAYLHGEIVGFAGALVFAASDSTLALDRFEQHRRWMPLAVMVTYHVAQAMLVLSLVR